MACWSTFTQRIHVGQIRPAKNQRKNVTKIIKEIHNKLLFLTNGMDKIILICNPTEVKTLGLSQIIDNASIISVPKYVINIVNKLIFQYIWGSKCEKVKRETITGYIKYQ